MMACKVINFTNKNLWGGRVVPPPLKTCSPSASGSYPDGTQCIFIMSVM